MKNNIFKMLLLAFLFTILLYFNIGYSQDNTNYKNSHPNIKVVIKYYNQAMYNVGSPIIIEFNIVNNDNNPFLFLTSFNKMFTFDFEVLTSSNRKIEHSKDYIIKRNQFEPVLTDEITLKKNELYGVKIDISKWFDLTESGEYVIRGIFYPELITNREYCIFTENELALYLNPSYPEKVKRREEIEEIKRLKAESMPPYKVVEFILNALIDKDFDKYFLYINFDKFIMQFKNAEKKYINAKDMDKPDIKEEFKQYLKGSNRLEDIPFSETIPGEYDIVRTVIEKSNAEVTVIETFKFKNLIEKKRYTYHLHLYGDKWLVDSYDVVNIGK